MTTTQITSKGRKLRSFLRCVGRLGRRPPGAAADPAVRRLPDQPARSL